MSGLCFLAEICSNGVFSVVAGSGVHAVCDKKNMKSRVTVTFGA